MASDRAARYGVAMVFRRTALSIAIAALPALGCSGSNAPDAGAPVDSGAIVADSGAIVADSGAAIDSGAAVDSGAADSGVADDSGVAPDSGAPAGDTWVSFAQGFTQTYCVGCHDANDATGRDYRMYALVFRDRAEIRCGVATARPADCMGFPPPRQFPIGNGAKPTDPERDRLVSWIEAGAPQQ
jgi:hypothetical protein